MKYTATDGSLWHLTNEPPPVPTRQLDWQYVHDDYDGAPDAYDDRHGHAPSRRAAIKAVEEWVAENGEEHHENEAALRDSEFSDELASMEPEVTP